MTEFNTKTAQSEAESDFTPIPPELKSCRQWVNWKGLWITAKDGKPKINKIPFDPKSNPIYKASTTDPATWGAFQQCLDTLPALEKIWRKQYGDQFFSVGIGFVFSKNDPYFGIDLDHCFDPMTGELEAWASEIVDQFQTYSERSPSGAGLHLIGKGKLPGGRGRRRGPVEVYDSGRYFTMTGDRINDHPVADSQAVLEMLMAEHFPTTENPHHAPETNGHQNLDDDLLKLMFSAKNGAAIRDLWDGGIPVGKSASEADLALCDHLAFWTGCNPGRMDQLFRQSSLMRDKWNRESYRQPTIQNAINGCNDTYTPPDDGSWQARGSSAHVDEDEAEDTRPEIVITPDIRAVTNQGQGAILNMLDGPHLYQRARRLVFIARGVKPPRYMSRPADSPIISEASSAHIKELVTTAAKWLRYDRRKKKYLETTPAPYFVETLQGRGYWPFPVLEGIVSTPTIRPDGSILDSTGYDEETGLYLDLNGVIFPPIPNKPTIDDARTAIGRLQEPFFDFPFVDEKIHFSAALAAVLSIVGRYAVQGNVPLFAVRSTTRGSGKGLLVDVVSIIGTGRPAPRWPQAAEDDEERKRLLTLGLDGDPLVLIDNINQPLGSPALDAAITAMTFKDRILGHNESKEVPMNAVFFACGNNMMFKGDMARRVLPIDLGPKVERPEERDDFQHPDLLAWVKQNRPRLVTAALTILAAYFEAGQPKQKVKQYGSFEQWSAIVRSVLVWSGEADPCDGRLDIEAESDPEFEAYCELLRSWEANYEDKAKTLKQVINDVGSMCEPNGPPTTWNELKDALGAFDPRYEGKGLNGRAIGNAIRKWHGRVHNEMRLEKAGYGGKTKTLRWRVQKFN